MDVDKDLIVYTGIVADRADHQYSSTSVHGQVWPHPDGVMTGNISSTIHHHHNQEMWIALDDGGEECIKLRNIGLEAQKGHTVTVIKNARTRCIERIINETTGKYWITGNSPASSFRLEFFVASFISSLPILSVLLFLLPKRIWINALFSGQFSGNYGKQILFGVMAVFSSSCALSYIGIESKLFPPKAGFTVSQEFQAKLYAPVIVVLDKLAYHYKDSDAMKRWEASEKRKADEFKQRYGDIKFSPHFESQYQKRMEIMRNGTPQEKAKEAFLLRDKVYSLPTNSDAYIKPLMASWLMSFFLYFLILRSIMGRYNQYCGVLDNLCQTTLRARPER